MGLDSNAQGRNPIVKIVEGPERVQRHAAGKIPLVIQLFIPRNSKPCVPFHPMESAHSVEPVARAELAITNYFDQQNLGWRAEIDRAWSL
jgi:hypothetical protein